MNKKDGAEPAIYSSVPSRQIVSLIIDKRYDDARDLIEIAQKKFPESESHQFKALSAVLHESRGEIDKSLTLMREALQEKPTWLPHLYRLSVMLMDAERWDEADAILSQLIALSMTKSEAYFLDESRFRRVLCLKMLGRKDELNQVKADIPEGASFYMNDGLRRIEDIT